MISCPYCGVPVKKRATSGEYCCPNCQKDFYASQIRRYTIPGIPYHKFTDMITKNVQIECDTISLKHKDLDIEVCLDHAIDNINSITINGVRFVREK